MDLICRTCERPFAGHGLRRFCSERCRQARAPAVYRFVCPDGRCYIGGVSDSRRRADSGIARSNSRLVVAFERHPPETWVYEVLERLSPGCSKRELHEAEQRHIDRWRSWSPESGFNIYPAIWTGDGPAQRAARDFSAALLAETLARQAAWRWPASASAQGRPGGVT